ncbi:modD protein [Coleofasciculus chthonoplastes PCC 7420]|uniref:Putative pyrophosphorylase ModD n=1 Tax=Coleofasciculus chthonoplastes PCC 7420 TaxID=118168 RepID=B4VJN5_9CYAN|nr:ModD protein [Coleofasciculus chthonoplastes]EDX77550.1 modD protein [Coleofasciculus chthonoplastes PCC 7420]
MVFISQQFIEQLIQEDVPYFDLTTQVLGIGDRTGTIRFTTRTKTVLACTEESASILRQVGAEVIAILATGQILDAGVPFLSATGNAAALHLAWKPAQNLLEYACGVATKTYNLVQLAQAANQDVMLYTTRKVIPGTKPIAVKAILAGGAYPHRLGVSETVLIFQQHLNFLGGIDSFIQQLPVIKRQVKEKKVIVEVKDMATAFKLATSGIDGIQFDKVNAEALAEAISQIKSINPTLITLAAGGINDANIANYAATGVDGLVLTAPYYAQPADIQVEMVCRGGFRDLL